MNRNRKFPKRLNSTPNHNKFSTSFMKEYYQKLVTKYINENPATNESATSTCNCNWCMAQNEMKSAEPTYPTSSSKHDELLQQVYKWKVKLATEKAALDNQYTIILE